MSISWNGASIHFLSLQIFRMIEMFGSERVADIIQTIYTALSGVLRNEFVSRPSVQGLDLLS